MRTNRMMSPLFDLTWDTPAESVRMPALDAIRQLTTAEKRLVGVRELAKVLDVSPGWVYRRTRLGTQAIPHYKVGRHVKFDVQEVLEFIRSGKAAGKLDEPAVS